MSMLTGSSRPRPPLQGPTGHRPGGLAPPLPTDTTLPLSQPHAPGRHCLALRTFGSRAFYTHPWARGSPSEPACLLRTSCLSGLLGTYAVLDELIIHHSLWLIQTNEAHGVSGLKDKRLYLRHVLLSGI